jgi:citrate lyase subunit beta/citryl-CoA lyase
MRSLLYVPATSRRKLERAATLPADALVLDLEDGVAPARKQEAREVLRGAVAEGVLEKAPPWTLRVNAPGTAWHEEDMALALELGPPRVLLPKAEDLLAVTQIARDLSEKGIGVGLMIETAAGVGKVRWLAGSNERIQLLVYGSADLRRSLGARPDPERRWEALAMQEILLAARMHDCRAIDAVYFHYQDGEGLARHARVARDLGFDGKSCIHPDQIPVIHEVFSTTEDERAWAEKVLAAWDEQEGEKAGVVTLEGEMIEALHLEVARRILGG